MTTLLFIRHGQTDWNVAGILQGQKDIPLNDTGRLQAQEVAKKLLGIPVDIIYSSPLCRAMETARIVASAIHYQKPIEGLDCLKERGFGLFEGQNLSDPSLREALWAHNSPYNAVNNAKGVEPIHALYDRVDSCLNNLCKLNAGKTLLLVSHGVVGAALRLHFESVPQGFCHEQLIPDNAEILRYQFE